MAVDDERMEVQQQRILVRRRGVEIPRLQVEEVGVLGVDAELLVVGQVHRLGGAHPRRRLVLAKIDPPGEGGVGVWRRVVEQLQHAGGVAQVEAGHHVRVEVVVDHGGVLVRTGDAVDVERVAAIAVAVAGDGRVEPEVIPHPRRFDEHLGAIGGEERDVAAGVDVALEGEGDRRVDVVLGGAGGVVGRRLLAVDRPPRVQRPGRVEGDRPATRPSAASASGSASTGAPPPASCRRGTGRRTSRCPRSSAPRSRRR